MRTLLHAFSTFELGGSQARFVQLANAFGPGYRHLIVAMDGRMMAGDRLGPSVNWQPMDIENRRGGALANRSAYRDALLDWQPDMLFSYNWGAIEWAAGNLPQRVPHVHVEDGFGPGEAQRQLPRPVPHDALWNKTPPALCRVPQLHGTAITGIPDPAIRHATWPPARPAGSGCRVWANGASGSDSSGRVGLLACRVREVATALRQLEENQRPHVHGGFRCFYI